MLADLWEEIPLWVVALVTVVVLVALYFGMRALNVPSWGYWLTFGGLAVGAIFAGLRVVAEAIGG